MTDFKGFYTAADIKPGDWLIVGDGSMAVGWNSACDHDYSRSIRWRVVRAKSVRKSVVLESNGWSIDRVEFDQVLGVFPSQEFALNVLGMCKAEWDARGKDIDDLVKQALKAKTDRFQNAVSMIRRWVNK
jgi:hypothetical protein